MLRNSAKAIILRAGKLLCTQNTGWRGDEYYILPGGGQEPGETLPEALQRECLEELGLMVAVGALRYIREYIGKNHAFAERHADVHQLEFMFICNAGGEPREKPSAPDAHQTGFAWLELARLRDYQIFPAQLSELIQTDGSLTGPVYLGDIN